MHVRVFYCYFCTLQCINLLMSSILETTYDKVVLNPTLKGEHLLVTPTLDLVFLD